MDGEPPLGRGVAPALPGDMKTIEIANGKNFLLQSGAYVASEKGVVTDTKWGGAKGFFGSGSLILLRVSGAGTASART